MGNTNNQSYGYIEDGAVFLKGYRNFPDREIGVVKESSEQALKYFEERFSLAEKKVNDLVEKVSTAKNKGSYMMKLIHMKEYIIKFNGLGDFETLLVKLEALEQDLDSLIHSNREKNHKLKLEIIDQLSTLTENTDFRETTPKIKDLQNRWIKIGKADDKIEEVISKQFHDQINAFFEKRDNYFQTKKLIFEDRLKQYQSLIEKAEELAKRENPKIHSKDFNNLHKDWKSIGKIPRDKMIHLWNEFKRQSDIFYDKLNNVNNEQKEFKSRPNNKLEERLILLDEAKKLTELNLDEAIEKAKDLQKAWKGLGFIKDPNYKENEKTFWGICDNIFETNYIQKTTINKHSDFYKLSFEQQAKLQIPIVKELIRRDQDELSLAEENYLKFNLGNNKSKTTRVIESKLHNLRRKLEAKETILGRLKSQVVKS